MTSSFYYHTKQFDQEEFAAKCLQHLDTLPAEFEEVGVKMKEQVGPEEFFDSRLTSDWETANHTETGIELDVPYPDLNEESKQQEIEHLRETHGQFFIIVLRIESENERSTCSALIEIHGKAGGGKTEFYVQELIKGEPEL
jgi:hypothetical protein